jgi:hypothetical protein
MDRQYAEQLLVQAKLDRVEAQAALESAQAAIESSQLIIQGLIRQFPDLLAGDETAWEWEESMPLIRATLGDPPELVERPRGSEAVLQVLQVNEDRDFQISDLVLELDRLGLLPATSANPANAVRTAVERLVADPESNVVKTRSRNGVFYRYSEPPEGVPVTGFDDEPF